MACDQLPRMTFGPLRCACCGKISIVLDEPDFDWRSLPYRSQHKVDSDGQCVPNGHCYESIPALLLWVAKDVEDRVGRTPTLDELRAEAQKRIDATDPEVLASGYVTLSTLPSNSRPSA